MCCPAGVHAAVIDSRVVPKGSPVCLTWQGAEMDRRSFLTLLGAACFAPVVPNRLHAQTKPAYGPLGLNLTGMSYWSNEHAFSNLGYNASRWRLQDRNAPFTWDAPLPPMTQDGYPTVIPPQTVLETFLIYTRRRHHLPAKLMVFYDGKGKLAYTGGAKLDTRAPGFDLITNLPNDAAIAAQLTETDPANPLRNIRVFEEGAMPDGTFRAPFISRVRNMACLRFMDWMGTNNSEIRHWQDRPTKGAFGRTEHGVPLEHMIELSNLVGVEPWFNMPHLADDTYVRQFAMQVRDTLDPSLRIYVEYSNEVWNFTFGQARHALEQGLRLGLSSSDYEAQLRFYAKRSTEMLSIWDDVFGEQKGRVLGVYGSHSANAWSSTTILDWDGARQFADILAVAPYFGGELGFPEKAGDVSDWSSDQLFATLTHEVADTNAALIRSQVKVAREYGVELAAYEGGQHLVGVGGAENNDKLNTLFMAANRDPRMARLYSDHLENWWTCGGGLYAAFSSMSEPSKWGSWGLLEFEGDDAVKWNALQRYLSHQSASKNKMDL